MWRNDERIKKQTKEQEWQKIKKMRETNEKRQDNKNTIKQL